MANVLQIVGICYFRGYEGKMYPAYCPKRKGNPCWEAYKKGKADKKKGVCELPDETLKIYRRYNY